MPPFRDLLALVPPPPDRAFAERLTSPVVSLLWLLASGTSATGAQGRAAPDTPLHVATPRVEFVTAGDTPPTPKPLAVHNGGTARLTDVRLTRLTYADSAHGGWLTSLPRQSTVAPDELATIGMLCVDATGLPAGTYRATGAVAAREVPEPVGVTITLVVQDPIAGARPATARCASAVTKGPTSP